MSKPRGIKKSKPVELKNFDISINEFGEIISSTPVDKINAFLNHNLVDKKIVDQPEGLNPLGEEE